MKFNALVLAALLSASPVWAQSAHPQRTPAHPAKKAVQNEAQQEKKAETPSNSSKIEHTPAYNEFLQAQQYEADGNFIQAVEAFKKVVELDPQSPEPHVALGEL